MASLKNIKLKIISVKKTSTVTRAMEAVSAVKMRKAQERALNGRSYAAAALTVLSKLSGTSDLSRYELMQPRAGKTFIVMITSDKGLAGSLNSSVIRETENLIKAKGLTTNDVVMVAIGRRGADFFANRGYEVRKRHENMSDAVGETALRAVTDVLLSSHANGEIGSAYVVYTNFLSTFEQQAVSRQIVPLTQKLILEIVEGIRPVRGKYAGQSAASQIAAVASYRIEPSADEILSVLIPRLVNVAIFHALLESKSSEHSARMVAMKNATDNAKARAKDYTRKFNKIRQANITREISEITSGIEAMK